MIILENITVYKCPHCKKYMLRKHSMEFHIKWCKKNPENIKQCFDCAYIKEETIEYDKYNKLCGDFEVKFSKAFKCGKLKKFLYPPIVEKKNLVEQYPETFKDQEPMRKKCEFYNPGYIDKAEWESIHGKVDND